jgi:hypothetical protein
MIKAAGPVSRILSATLLLRDDHSSGPDIAARLKRPTRRFDAPSRHVLATVIPKNQSRGLPSYLVLLRVGFALPATLLPRRCAFTAPFHPYPVSGAVCFLWHFPSIRLEPDVPDVIRHTALRSSDFPLLTSEDARSGRPVRLPTNQLYDAGPEAETFDRQANRCESRQFAVN